MTRRVCPCGAPFYARHGNQRYCSLECSKRKRRRPKGVPRFIVFAPRLCDHCGRRFVPRASHGRFCSYSCQQLGRRPEDRAKYHNPVHRQLRKQLAPFVASGAAVCGGPNGCGKPILRGEPWDLGHEPGNPAAYVGPQHARCNRRTAGKRERPAGKSAAVMFA